MLAFYMDGEAGSEFFRRVSLLSPEEDCEDARTKILVQMSKEGWMERVVESKKSKAEYVKALQKNFNVLDLQNPEDADLNAQWCIDNETGQEVLVDLETYKIIARKSGGKLLKPEGD